MSERKLLIATIVSVVAFAIIAGLVFLSGAFASWDQAASVWYNQLELGPSLGGLFVAASEYGREYFWIGLLVVMLGFGDSETKEMAVQLAAVFVVGIVAGEALKAMLFRARPEDVVVRVAPDLNSSFPSGHALIVTIGATFALLAFRKKWVAGLLALEALVVCISRVYVGAHFPSDVLAGAVAGVAIACGGLIVERRYFTKAVKRVSAAVVRVLHSGPLRL